MYIGEPYVLTDAIKANVTELYFGSDADFLEQSKMIQAIYTDCDMLQMKLENLEEDVKNWRYKYYKLKIECNKLTNGKMEEKEEP